MAAATLRLAIVTHRYCAGGVGIVIMMLSALVWTVPRHRTQITGWSMTGLCLVVLQTVLGLWTLEHRLLPLAVTGHLLLGFVLLLSLYRLYLALGPERISVATGAGPRWLARLALLLLISQLALGAWTSTHAAGLACPDFPSCLGQTWPDVDFSDGFTLWRGTSPNTAENPPPLAARAAIHWSHRVGGLATYLVITALAVVISAEPSCASLRKAAIPMSALVLAETALGIAAIVLRLPIPIVVAHATVAGLLLLSVASASVRMARPHGTRRG